MVVSFFGRSAACGAVYDLGLDMEVTEDMTVSITSSVTCTAEQALVTVSGGTLTLTGMNNPK